MSHVTHMNESCPTDEWVMWHIWETDVSRMNESCHTSKWVRSCIWMSNVTDVNKTCQTFKCIMSHIWTSHVTHIIKLCQIYKCVMSRVWISHVTHTNRSCHTIEGVMSHMSRRHVTHMNVSRVYTSIVTHVNESCHTCKWVISHIYTSNITHLKQHICRSKKQTEYVLFHISHTLFVTCMMLAPINDPCPNKQNHDKTIWLVTGAFCYEIFFVQFSFVIICIILFVIIWKMHESQNRDSKRHVTRMNQSYHMPHVWISHITRMNQYYHAYVRDMSLPNWLRPNEIIIFIPGKHNCSYWKRKHQ